MENIRAYMESGILELYVLGDLHLTERSQVEKMASRYPQVKNELNAIADTLTKYTFVNAVEPDIPLRHKILNNLFND